MSVFNNLFRNIFEIFKLFKNFYRIKFILIRLLIFKIKLFFKRWKIPRANKNLNKAKYPSEKSNRIF